jgi:hypothetical protein
MTPDQIRERIRMATRHMDGTELIAELEKLSDRALAMVWNLTLECGAYREPPLADIERARAIETAIIRHFKRSNKHGTP